MKRSLVYLACWMGVSGLSGTLGAEEKKAAAPELEGIFQSARASLNGTGVPADPAQAFALMKQAAEGGHAEAEGGLGYLYSSGIGTAVDEKEAVVWFRKGAEKGAAKAQFNLGRMLLNGRGVARDEKEGWQWWEKAAAQGLAEAVVAVADSYYFGENGQEKSFEKAYPLYRQAAERGSAAAQNFVGVMRRDGQGIALDEEEARKWFSKSAEQGYGKAQSNLGHIILSRPKDAATRVEALKWLMLADMAGEITATNTLHEILPKMAPAETAKAREQFTILRAELQRKKAGKRISSN